MPTLFHYPTRLIIIGKYEEKNEVDKSNLYYAMYRGLIDLLCQSSEERFPMINAVHPEKIVSTLSFRFDPATTRTWSEDSFYNYAIQAIIYYLK